MIEYNMPMEDYLALPHMGSSTLKKILTTPADFKAALSQKHEDTKFTSLGTAIHTAILEPDEFNKRYVMQPEEWGDRNIDKRTNMWKEFKLNNSEKIALDWEASQLIKRIYVAARKHKMLQALLEDGKAEVTCFKKISEIDLDLKARTDLLLSHGIADVKSCSDSLDDNNLFKIIFNNGYHFQLAHHFSVIADCFPENELLDFYWIFVSTTTPAVHIRIVKCPDELLDWGLRDFKTACEIYKGCVASDLWPGYAPGIVSDLQIPDWARRLYG